MEPWKTITTEGWFYKKKVAVLLDFLQITPPPQFPQSLARMMALLKIWSETTHSSSVTDQMDGKLVMPVGCHQE